MSGPRPAVFLDRDGTLNVEVDYLDDPDALQLYPGVGTALRALAEAGYLLVVVTNQSGIARGMFDEARLAEIHERLATELARDGVTLDWIGYCPHHPEHGDAPYRARCLCRKPGSGLLVDAQCALDIDVSRSWIVGDSERDLAAGAELGVPGILVATGKGEREHARLVHADRAPEHFVRDLPAAAHVVLEAGPG